MLQINVNLDLEAIVDDEYERSLKSYIRQTIKDQVGMLVRKEVADTYRATISRWVKDGFGQIRYEDGEVVLPLFTKEDLK